MHDINIILDKLFTFEDEDALNLVILIAASVFVWFFSRVLHKQVKKKYADHKNVDVTILLMLIKIMRLFAIFLIIITVLYHFGIKVNALVAIFSAMSIAIGFALHKSIGNVASGLSLLLFRPFKVGDSIEFENQYYIVEEVSLFYVELKDSGNSTSYVPCHKFMGSNTIRNLTHSEVPLLTHDITLNFDIDPQRVLDKLHTLFDDSDYLNDKKPCNVYLNEISMYGYNFKIKLYYKADVNYFAQHHVFLVDIDNCVREMGYQYAEQSTNIYYYDTENKPTTTAKKTKAVTTRTKKKPAPTKKASPKKITKK